MKVYFTAKDAKSRKGDRNGLKTSRFFAYFAVSIIFSLLYTSILATEECPPASSGGGHSEGGGEKKRGGGGVGVGISIDLSKFGKKQKKEEEDPFAEPPKRVKTVENSNNVVIALNERGQPVGSKPEKQPCCVFTSFTLRNTWNNPVAVEIHNERGALTGSASLQVGESHTFRGELGECIRITVASPQARHSLIEDVRICCKDVGQRSYYFYGIRLVNYTSRKCGEGGGGSDPRDQPQTETPGSKSRPKPGDDPRDLPTDAPPPPTPQGGITIPTPVDGGQPHTGSTPQPGGTGTTTRPPPGGTGTTTKPPPGDDPRDHPQGDDPRDLPQEKVGLLFTRMVDDWLPENGNVASVQVQIFRKDRTTGRWIYPGPKRVITVLFVERSAEKGICLNFGNQTTPDLAFVPYMNSPWNCTPRTGTNPDFPDMAVTKEPVQMALLNINSYDYGSFSKLAASAPGCVHLQQSRTGEVTEITAEQAQLAVPKDDNHNQITDCWIEDWMSRTPVEDTDNNPRNLLPGDGLSPYEEYRGFMVKGVHRRTSVDEKDLFLYNPGNFPTAKLKSFSGFQVHEVGEDEWQPRTNIINYNRGNAALPQPQHLLKISSGNAAGDIPGLLGRCVPKNEVRFGPPKNVQEILIFFAAHFIPIPGAPEGPTMLDADQLATTVAHESGHGLGAAHHGEGYAEIVWLQPVGGSSTPPPDLTVPERFHDGPDLFGISLPRAWPIVSNPCTYSGPWTCVMRYRIPEATAFYRRGVFEDIMTGPDNIPFREYCRSSFGDRDNGHGLGGDCAPGRGDCGGKLRISDAYQHNPP